jgi:parallel beta-helix repeat protein
MSKIRTIRKILSSSFRKARRPLPVRLNTTAALECLEARLVCSASSPAPALAAPSLSGQVSASFSTDERTVTLQAQQKTFTINRPLVSPWSYQAVGKTYWVAPGGNDQADGSAAHPFATISRAVAAAAPGDIIDVRAGTYAGDLFITKSGQAGKPIIITAAPGDLGKVLITPSQHDIASNPDAAVITLDAANYVWINGLVIEGSRGRPGAPTSEHYGANGITWEGGAGLGDRATNNVVYNNVHCGLKEMHHGGSGIFIQGNIIFDNGTSSLDHGIYMPADNVTMSGNVIFDNSGYGIHSYISPTNQVIAHNIIFGNTTGGILLAGSHTQVYYNTVVGNGVGIFYFRGGCADNVVEHNIFAFNRVNAGYDNGGGKLGDPSNNRDDYNCYFQGALDARVQVGPHDMFANPGFVDAQHGDFRPNLAGYWAPEGAFM